LNGRLKDPVATVVSLMAKALPVVLIAAFLAMAISGLRAGESGDIHSMGSFL
jgi:predicted RecA/RadA family phage recombinase